MTRKQWIVVTLVLAVFHILLTNLLIMPPSTEILFSRFDGNDYNSPWDRPLLGLYFFLHFPYLFMLTFLPPLRYLDPMLRTYFLWVGNSLIWGLLGAWLISKLPLFKEQDLPE